MYVWRGKRVISTAVAIRNVKEGCGNENLGILVGTLAAAYCDCKDRSRNFIGLLPTLEGLSSKRGFRRR